MTQHVQAPPTPAEAPRPLPLRIPWSLGSGTILLGLNSAMIAVAVVPMAGDFGSSAAVAWIVSSLYIAAAVGSPTAGRLADVFGARRVYLVGLALILVASLAGPFMPTAEWMIADRVLLGLGASAQFPAAMAIIRQQAAARGSRPAGAIGIVAMCGQTTAALGPTVGGFVVLLWGWPGIFWINLPMVALCGALVLAFVPADPRSERAGIARRLASLDPLGMLLMVGVLVLIMMGLLSADGGDTWWIFLGAGVPVLALFVWREAVARTPFVDVRLMVAFPAFGMTLVRAVATFVSFYCIFYGLPQWFQGEVGLDAGYTGLLMLPVFGVGAISTWIASQLGARVRPWALLTVGTAAMVVAGAGLALLTDADSPTWWFVVVCALLGVPNGFNNLGNQLILNGAVPAHASGSATGVYRTAQYVGAALAAIVVAHTIGAPGGSVAWLGWVIAGIGAVLLVTAIAALITTRRTA